MKVNLVARVSLSVVLVYVCEVLCLPHRATLDNRADSGLQVNWTSVNSFENFEAINPSYMNLSVDPCDDFYEYACGNWKHVHPIKKHDPKSSVMQLLKNNIGNALRESLSEPVSPDHLGQELGAEEKARVYFAACVDKDTIEKRGVEPLLQFIDELGGWPVLDENWSEETFDWLQLAIKMSLLGQPCILATIVDKDLKNSTRYALYLDEPDSLNLNNWDYISISKYMEHLDDYKDLIVNFLMRLGVDSRMARNTANEIVDFEIQLASIKSGYPESVVDPDIFPSITIEGLYKRYSNIDWLTYLSGVQETTLQPNQTVVLLTESYYDNLGRILEETKSRTLANFMVWRSVLLFASALDTNLYESLKTFEKVLAGHEEPVPRWKNCVQEVDSYMWMVTGALFVRQHFDEDSKNETITLLSDIKEVFQEFLLDLDWIDENTKDLVRSKLNQMEHSIGYPEYILNSAELDKLYRDLQVIPDKHFENFVNLSKYASRVNRKKLQDTVHKEVMFFHPTTVNAGYSQKYNIIIVPAAFLQFPIFHKNFPTREKCARLGTVLGHEVTHAFDDSSREYDSNRNMNQSWSPEALKEFKKRVNCFIEQYGKYSIDGAFVNGTHTRDENIADNGGIRQAFKIYRKWQKSNGTPSEVMSNDQLFFVGFAQLWCAAIRPNHLKEMLKDVHTPPKFRVIGSLSNFEEFSDAFQCPTGSYMNPEKKCRLW